MYTRHVERNHDKSKVYSKSSTSCTTSLQKTESLQRILNNFRTSLQNWKHKRNLQYLSYSLYYN